MPRIKVTNASAAAAAAHPREFALLHQFNGPAGEVESELLAPYAPKDALAALTKEGELSFDKFAEAVKLPSQSKDAQGEGNFLGWGASDTSGKLQPIKFKRRDLGAKDIHIKITHCGMCHSDLHTIRGEWGKAKYPIVPGHEIIGIVTAVGKEVSKFKLGDRAAVGCFVDSCKECKWCKLGDEPYCPKVVWTYNSDHYDGVQAQGGYSTGLVVLESYGLRVPPNLPMANAAPLLCAGITVWTPMHDYGLNKKGLKLGVVGLGGLGHMAVKLGHAFGCEVTVISRSRAKEAEARAMGADNYLVSTDKEAMKAAAGTLQGIIDTVSAEHDLGEYFALLEPRSTLALVGLPPHLKIPHQPIVGKHLQFGGSAVGNLRDTQEMLDFCGKHNVTCDVEVIDVNYVNEAMERLEKGDVKFRFVIDISKSLIQ